MVDLVNVKSIHVPSFYICNGTEQGVCESVFDGITYRYYINSARNGAVIMYLDGHFYVIGTGVDMTQPDVQKTEIDIIPVPDAPQQIEIYDEPAPTPTPEPTPPPVKKTVVIFDTPNVEIIPGTSIEYNVQKTGDSIKVSYRVSGTTQWVEIPVLTDADVVRIEGGVGMVSAHIEQSGTTARFS